MAGSRAVPPACVSVTSLRRPPRAARLHSWRTATRSCSMWPVADLICWSTNPCCRSAAPPGPRAVGLLPAGSWPSTSSWSSLPTSAPSAAECLVAVIDAEERRDRLAVRHHLVPSSRIDDVPQIADDLVALHSSDPVTVYLSATARMRSPSLAAVDKALYEDRSLIRHHGMRRTLWVSTPEVVRLIHAAATRDLIPGERRRTAALLAASGIDDPERWLDEAAEQVLADLHEHGPSTARELGQRVEALRHPLQLSPGKKWAATQSAHVRVLLALCLQGKLLRSKPVGSWINGAYRYAAADCWLGGGCGVSVRQPHPTCSGGWAGRSPGPSRLWRTAERSRSASTVGSAGWLGMIPAWLSRNHGWRCCPAWIRPPWAGSPAPGTCRQPRPRRSTATATRVPPSGSMAGWLAPGPKTARGRSGRITSSGWL